MKLKQIFDIKMGESVISETALYLVGWVVDLVHQMLHPGQGGIGTDGFVFGGGEPVWAQHIENLYSFTYYVRALTHMLVDISCVSVTLW